MMTRIGFILFFLSACFFESSAQDMTAEQYIEEHKDMAIREMKRMGVPAAITIAQGLLETENGNSDLVKKSNNHFGIKCKSSWTAATIKHDDDAPGECFRVYENAEESYRDHSNFLRSNARYAFLFQLDPTDYRAWAYGLRKAGYATNPRYPEILIKNIETNHLEQYSLEAAGEVPVFDGSKYNDDPEVIPSVAVENLPVENTAVESTSVKNASVKNIPVENASVQNTDPPVPVPGRLAINGSRAIFVKKGTSLLAIASQYKINLSRLLEINDLAQDGLLVKDQFVFLEKKQKEGDRDFCIAAPGETLFDIAQKNGVQLQSLYSYNHLNADDRVAAGTKIYLKQIAAKEMVVTTGSDALLSGETSPAPVTKNPVPQIHQVQSKEGLYSISKKYGVSVDQIKEWNNLQSDQLKIGQRLIISK